MISKMSLYSIVPYTSKTILITKSLLVKIIHESLAMDVWLVPKISKQDIKSSFHRVTQMGLEPHQNFFQILFSTNMVAGGVQSFCILEGATDSLIEQWPKYFGQFSTKKS